MPSESGGESSCGEIGTSVEEQSEGQGGSAGSNVQTLGDVENWLGTNESLEDWLGSNYKTSSSRKGEPIFTNEETGRRIRTDIDNPGTTKGQPEQPHIHFEEFDSESGKWQPVDSEHSHVYQGDKPPVKGQEYSID
ncbi:MAG: hypothetical protein FWB84_03670 [Candidatus Bathyarchaeota archaeon]|uniref:hypothetical protein n=1 Tax=Candidatus Bathycorpusculum sp. TaxID=2994959 RepID=UPI002823A6DE|nr:hypothetical protein [Candidatus Termiticorpusculum sp.]MCL2292655.1 hypothetical protein [Candidatus Termiticorpusculum sp.]